MTRKYNWQRTRAINGVCTPQLWNGHFSLLLNSFDWHKTAQLRSLATESGRKRLVQWKNGKRIGLLPKRIAALPSKKVTINGCLQLPHVICRKTKRFDSLITLMNTVSTELTDPVARSLLRGELRPT